jgi:hypothetical protein
MPSQSKDKGLGSWIPQEIADAALRLDLRPPSRWKVFLAVLFPWCRYGQTVALLTIENIVSKTGLSERTVKAALKDLTKLGILRRLGLGKLVVEVCGSDNAVGGESARKPASTAGDEACTLTRCSMSLSNVSKEPAKGLTRRQFSAIRIALVEASDLLGEDASKLSLPSTACHSVGLPENTTIREALLRLQNNCNRKIAHTLTGAILALRFDERVQGNELTGPDTTPSS